MEVDDLDIYDDLDEFQEQEERKTSELLALEAKYNDSLKTIDGLRLENKDLKKKLKTIEVNFQNLLDTARAEMRRKDNRINELAREKDDILFRRMGIKSDNRDNRGPPQSDYRRTAVGHPHDASKEVTSVPVDIPASEKETIKHSRTGNKEKNIDNRYTRDEKRSLARDHNNHRRERKSDVWNERSERDWSNRRSDGNARRDHSRDETKSRTEKVGTSKRQDSRERSPKSSKDTRKSSASRGGDKFTPSCHADERKDKGCLKEKNYVNERKNNIKTHNKIEKKMDIKGKNEKCVPITNEGKTCEMSAQVKAVEDEKCYHKSDLKSSSKVSKESPEVVIVEEASDSLHGLKNTQTFEPFTKESDNIEPTEKNLVINVMEMLKKVTNSETSEKKGASLKTEETKQMKKEDISFKACKDNDLLMVKEKDISDVKTVQMKEKGKGVWGVKSCGTANKSDAFELIVSDDEDLDDDGLLDICISKINTITNVSKEKHEIVEIEKENTDDKDKSTVVESLNADEKTNVSQNEETKLIETTNNSADVKEFEKEIKDNEIAPNLVEDKEIDFQNKSPNDVAKQQKEINDNKRLTYSKTSEEKVDTNNPNSPEPEAEKKPKTDSKEPTNLIENIKTADEPIDPQNKDNKTENDRKNSPEEEAQQKENKDNKEHSSLDKAIMINKKAVDPIETTDSQSSKTNLNDSENSAEAILEATVKFWHEKAIENNGIQATKSVEVSVASATFDIEIGKELNKPETVVREQPDTNTLKQIKDQSDKYKSLNLEQKKENFLKMRIENRNEIERDVEMKTDTSGICLKSLKDVNAVSGTSPKELESNSEKLIKTPSKELKNVKIQNLLKNGNGQTKPKKWNFKIPKLVKAGKEEEKEKSPIGMLEKSAKNLKISEVDKKTKVEKETKRLQGKERLCSNTREKCLGNETKKRRMSKDSKASEEMDNVGKGPISIDDSKPKSVSSNQTSHGEEDKINQLNENKASDLLVVRENDDGAVVAPTALPLANEQVTSELGENNDDPLNRSILKGRTEEEELCLEEVPTNQNAQNSSEKNEESARNEDDEGKAKEDEDKRHKSKEGTEKDNDVKEDKNLKNNDGDDKVSDKTKNRKEKQRKNIVKDVDKHSVRLKKKDPGGTVSLKNAKTTPASQKRQKKVEASKAEKVSQPTKTNKRNAQGKRIVKSNGRNLKRNILDSSSDEESRCAVASSATGPFIEQSNSSAPDSKRAKFENDHDEVVAATKYLMNILNKSDLNESAGDEMNKEKTLDTDISSTLVQEPELDSVSPVVVLNKSQDDKFKEIDTRLQCMFASPRSQPSPLHQNSVDFNISDSIIHDTSGQNFTPTNNHTVEETLNASSFNGTELNYSNVSNASLETTKHISLGSSDYRFEKVSDNVVNLFITRKRRGHKKAKSLETS